MSSSVNKEECKKHCEKAVKTKRLVITHVNAPERAEQLKADFEKLAEFKEIVLTNAMGVATIYANDKGIILAL